MAKKVYAVTNIKLSATDWYPAGEEVDPRKFTREQLVELHNAGAIEVRAVGEVPTDSVESKNDESAEQQAAQEESTNSETEEK